MSSLRYGLANYKSDSKIRPPEQLTYYKPFNIKELEFDVWDTFDERKDDYQRKFQHQGLNSGLGNGMRRDENPIYGKQMHSDDQHESNHFD